MSTELKARFTADASDFNAQVRAVEGRLKGLGGVASSLGGRGVGSVLNNGGMLAMGLGKLGPGGALAGLGLGAMAAAVASLTAAFEQRKEAIAKGLPVEKLTALGEFLDTYAEGVDVAKRSLNLGLLATEGWQAYVENLKKVGRFSDDFAKALAEKASILRSDIARDKEQAERSQRAYDLLIKGRERNAEESQKEGDKTVAESKKAQDEITRILEGPRLQNRLTELEMRGQGVRADAIRIADQVNAITGADTYSPYDIEQLIGNDLARARELAGGNRALPQQFAPDLTDRLTAMGGLSGRSTDGTPREMLSAEKQQVDLQKSILDTLRQAGGTVLR